MASWTNLKAQQTLFIGRLSPSPIILPNRTFYIQYGEDSSRKALIQTGVPQGSVLGPILYFLSMDIPLAPDTLTGLLLMIRFSSLTTLTTFCHLLQSYLSDRTFYMYPIWWGFIVESINPDRDTHRGVYSIPYFLYTMDIPFAPDTLTGLFANDTVLITHNSDYILSPVSIMPIIPNLLHPISRSFIAESIRVCTRSYTQPFIHHGRIKNKR